MYPYFAQSRHKTRLNQGASPSALIRQRLKPPGLKMNPNIPFHLASLDVSETASSDVTTLGGQYLFFDSEQTIGSCFALLRTPESCTCGLNSETGLDARSTVLQF